MFNQSSARLLLGIILTCVLVESGFAMLGVSDLQQSLPKHPERPYLHFTKGEVRAMRERVTQGRAKDVYQRLLWECNRLLDMPVSLDVPPRYKGINPYFEGQDAFGNYRDKLSESAYSLGFIYQMTGDETYARKSYQFAEALTALDSWVDTWDKFQWLYWMGKPFGAKWNEQPDNEIVYSYELGAAAVSRQLAATYDWIYPTLNEYQRKKLANALLENAVLRVRGNYDYHWWAHAWRTNWLPVCFSGVGLAALALYPEDPQLLDVVEETRLRINRYFDESIGLDGDCQEGVGYWRYGMENAVLFAATLQHASGGKVDMFEHPKLKNTVQFPMYTFTPPRGSVPFGDGREALQGSWELYNKLAEALKSRQAKWLAQFFSAADASAHEGELALFSVIWPEAGISPSLPEASKPMSFHFRTIDWVILRASWDSVDYPLLAAKGGTLDDPHHGHLDAGQFAIKYRGDWFVKELGYMSPYGLGYWDYRRRFKDYVHSNSLGHNVMFVNGEQQEYGQQYFGKVTRFRTSQNQDYVIIDASNAYPGRELRGWRRHIIFNKPSFFVVLDEVKSAPGAEVVARVHPGVPVRLKEGYALFTGQGGMMAMLPLLPKKFTINEDHHPFLPEQRDAQFSWIPYCDLITKASDSKTYIVNVFAPIENEPEAEEILHSGKLSFQDRMLRCVTMYKGKQFSSDFDISGDFGRVQ
jgi:Heparinase II/III-like protein